MNIIAKNFFSIVAGNVVIRALSFLVVAYLARTLGPQGFGQISWAVAAYTFGANFADFGLQVLGIRTIAQNPQEIQETVSDIVALKVCLSAGAILGLVVFAGLSGQSQLVKLLTVLYALGLGFVSVEIEWVFTGLQQMKYVGFGQVIQYLTYAGLLFVLVRDPGQILILPIAASAGMVVSTAFLVVQFRRQYPSFAFRPNPRRWLSILRQAAPIGASNVIAQVYVSLPILMLGWFRDDSAVGYFNGAYRVMQIPYEVIGIFLLILNPAVAGRWKNAPETVNALLNTVLRLIVTFCVPVAMASAAIGAQVLTLVLGQQFAASTLAFQVLMWNLVVVGVTGIYTQLALNMNGQQGRSFVVVAAGAIASIVLDLVLIPSFSYVGAAIAWVLAQALLCLLGYWISRPFVSLSFWACFLRSVVASVPMVLVCQLLVGWDIAVWLIIPVGVLVYGLALFVIGGMHAQDVDLVKQILASAGLRRERQSRD